MPPDARIDLVRPQDRVGRRLALLVDMPARFAAFLASAHPRTLGLDTETANVERGGLYRESPSLLQVAFRRPDGEVRVGVIDLLAIRDVRALQPHLVHHAERLAREHSLEIEFIRSVHAFRKTVITISSSAGHLPDARAPIPYGAAKAAIALLTQDVAAQVGPFGIRANCIAPETILTERNRERIPPAQQQALIDRHPLKRLGTPEDVAKAAVFLASDSAAWITGVLFDVARGAIMI